MPDTATLTTVLEQAVLPLTNAAVFASVKQDGTTLRCDAMHVEEECYYAVSADESGTIWAGWYSPDRWISGSIEGDLVHTGDKIDDLLEEELVDQGVSQKITLEHYRNTDKIFVFQGKLDLPADTAEAAALVTKVLLAFQACFLELGDMSPEEE